MAQAQLRGLYRYDRIPFDHTYLCAHCQKPVNPYCYWRYHTWDDTNKIICEKCLYKYRSHPKFGFEED